MNQRLQPLASVFAMSIRQCLTIQLVVLAIESFVHKATEVVIVQHYCAGKTPRKFIDSLVKLAVVPDMINCLFVTFMSIGESRDGVNLKLVLEFSDRRLLVVIQINIKVRFEAFDQPITIVGNTTSLGRKRGEPGDLRKSVGGIVQGG